MAADDEGPGLPKKAVHKVVEAVPQVEHNTQEWVTLKLAR